MLGANDVVEMIKTEGSDTEEDDNAWDNPNFDEHNVTDKDSDNETSASVNQEITFGALFFSSNLLVPTITSFWITHYTM